MKKIITTAVLCGIVVTSYAMTKDEEAKAFQEKWAKEHFAKLGVPIPDGGVVIKPTSEMSTPKGL